MNSVKQKLSEAPHHNVRQLLYITSAAIYILEEYSRERNLSGSEVIKNSVPKLIKFLAQKKTNARLKSNQISCSESYKVPGSKSNQITGFEIYQKPSFFIRLQHYYYYQSHKSATTRTIFIKYVYGNSDNPAYNIWDEMCACTNTKCSRNTIVNTKLSRVLRTRRIARSVGLHRHACCFR